MIKNIMISIALFSMNAKMYAAQALERPNKHIDKNLRQELFRAVRKNDIEQVKQLFAADSIPDVNALEFEEGHRILGKYQYGDPAFFTAIEKGYTEMVQVFLDNGVDVNNLRLDEHPFSHNALSRTIYYCGREYRHGPELFSVLLSCPRLAINSGRREKTDWGPQEYREYSPLRDAICYNDFSLVSQLLQAGAALKEANGIPALLIAFHCKKNPNIPALLMDYGADPYEVDAENRTVVKQFLDTEHLDAKYKSVLFLKQIQTVLDGARQRVKDLLVSHPQSWEIPPVLADIIVSYAVPTLQGLIPQKNEYQSYFIFEQE